MINKLKDFFKELISFVFSAPKDEEQAPKDLYTLPEKGIDVALTNPSELKKALDILEKGNSDTLSFINAWDILMYTGEGRIYRDKINGIDSTFHGGNKVAGFNRRLLYM